MPTLNDKILAWLAAQSITAPAGSFTTGQPEGGDDAVQTWDATALGPMPSVEQLNAVIVLPNRDELKAARQTQVDAITVSVNGKVFDGDETSQERMARALRVADITGQTSCTWVLHDNTAVTATKDELAQALALAMQAQGAMWVIP